MGEIYKKSDRFWILTKLPFHYHIISFCRIYISYNNSHQMYRPIWMDYPVKKFFSTKEIMISKFLTWKMRGFLDIWIVVDIFHWIYKAMCWPSIYMAVSTGCAITKWKMLIVNFILLDNFMHKSDKILELILIFWSILMHFYLLWLILMHSELLGKNDDCNNNKKFLKSNNIYLASKIKSQFLNSLNE